MDERRDGGLDVYDTFADIRQNVPPEFADLVVEGENSPHVEGLDI